MNNETVSILTNEIISGTYEAIIQLYICIGSYAVLIYASLLHFSDEVEYIWKKKFSLPTYLYLLSKYPLFFNCPLIVLTDFSQFSSLCDDFGNLSRVLTILAFLGVQGLISVRTYALCQGYRRLVAAIIFIMISASLAAQIYEMNRPYCTASPPSKSFYIIEFFANITVVVLDILAFVVIIHRVWGLWKLKRSTSLWSNGDLTTSILGQGVLRFCFVLILTTTGIFLSFFALAINDDFVTIQNLLSTLLICEFTLDLRGRDAKKEIPDQSAINLPTLSFRENPVQSMRSALGRLHESVVAEMGERNELVPVDRDNSGSSEPDGLQNDLRGINLVNPHEDHIEVV